MTISGPIIDLSDLKPLELIKASKAQDYIKNLESELMKADGSPLYLVHDGWSRTSDDFVAEAWNHLQEHGTIEGTLLLTLIERLISNGNSFRIWYASNDPKAYLNAVTCSDLKEILEVVNEQGSKIQEIQIRYLGNKALKTEAD